MLGDILRRLLERLREGGIGDGEALSKIVHSPMVALLVKLSPNKVDDTILEILKALVPPPQ